MVAGTTSFGQCLVAVLVVVELTLSEVLCSCWHM